MHPEQPLGCPHCGEPCESVILCEYDAMVDGPGCVESEERCEACVSGEAAPERTRTVQQARNEDEIEDDWFEPVSESEHG